MHFYLSTHPLHLVFRNPSRQVFGGLGWSLVGPWICDYVARLLTWVIHRDDWPTGQIVLYLVLYHTAPNTGHQFVETRDKPLGFDFWQRRGMGQDGTM
jgi:hypothetical protein